MTKYITACVAVLACLLGVSCSPTPASRISQHSELYYKLPVEQRQLVSQGRIAKGMSPSAVFLAWGNPSSVAEGNIGGRHTVRWIYTSLRPAYTPRWGGGYWGPWGPRGYWGPGFYGGYYDDVTYVPVDAGYVLFKNNIVDSWEKKTP